MSEMLSGNIEEVLQGIADAMDQRIDVVLESVLYAALSRMQAAEIIDSKWPDLLSGIASAHPQGQAFKAPSLTVIDGGKAPTLSE